MNFWYNMNLKLQNHASKPPPALKRGIKPHHETRKVVATDTITNSKLPESFVVNTASNNTLWIPASWWPLLNFGIWGPCKLNHPQGVRCLMSPKYVLLGEHHKWMKWSNEELPCLEFKISLGKWSKLMIQDHCGPHFDTSESISVLVFLGLLRVEAHQGCFASPHQHLSSLSI